MNNIAGSAAKSAGMTEEEVFGSAYDHRVVTRLIPYVAPYKMFMAVALGAMLVFAATNVAVPWIIKLAIDGYIQHNDKAGLTLIIAAFFGNAVINWLSNFAMEISIAKAGQGVLFGLRGAMFRHLQRLSLNFFNKIEVGRLMSRVQGDVG
ncbi:MAG: ABC transporter ATP-binding protein [SAR202 cluster bacterium]|nr:ABC transporter ATP-binding protein [SAR202 cluster bacterium]